MGPTKHQETIMSDAGDQALPKSAGACGHGVIEDWRDALGSC